VKGDILVIVGSMLYAVANVSEVRYFLMLLITSQLQLGFFQNFEKVLSSATNADY